MTLCISEDEKRRIFAEMEAKTRLDGYFTQRALSGDRPDYRLPQIPRPTLSGAPMKIVTSFMAARAVGK